MDYNCEAVCLPKHCTVLVCHLKHSIYKLALFYNLQMSDKGIDTIYEEIGRHNDSQSLEFSYCRDDCKVGKVAYE